MATKVKSPFRPPEQMCMREQANNSTQSFGFMIRARRDASMQTRVAGKIASRAAASSAARMGAGALAGAAATFVMDGVTELFYTESIKRREMEISPKSAGVGVATKLLDALKLEPNVKDAEKAATILHWTIGIGSGMAAGLLADNRPTSAVNASAVVSVLMTLFDEFGMSAMGAVPPSSEYPWQTNFRSVVGHVIYCVVLASAYGLLIERDRTA